MDHSRLQTLLLIFAVVSFVLSAGYPVTPPTWPWPNIRLMAFGLACLAASFISW